MTDQIADAAVALSLMREALTLLDGPDDAEAADLLRRAIAAAEGQTVVGQAGPTVTNGGARQAKGSP